MCTLWTGCEEAWQPYLALQIQLLQLDGEKDRLTALQSFTHPQEVWSIVPSPSSQSHFITTYTDGKLDVTGKKFSVHLWAISDTTEVTLLLLHTKKACQKGLRADQNRDRATLKGPIYMLHISLMRMRIRFMQALAEGHAFGHFLTRAQTFDREQKFLMMRGMFEGLSGPRLTLQT